MRFLVFVMAMIISWHVTAQDNICRKGFDRLVAFANSDKVTKPDFAEALIIVDSLLDNKCYTYKIDRLGTVYAGASLSYLFGKICGIKGDTAAIAAYAVYVMKIAEPMDDEMGMMFYKLFEHKPVIVLGIIKGNPQETELIDMLALGFIENARDQYYKRVSRSDYKGFFYEKNPTLKDGDIAYRVQVAKIIASIDDFLNIE